MATYSVKNKKQTKEKLNLKTLKSTTHETAFCFAFYPSNTMTIQYNTDDCPHRSRRMFFRQFYVQYVCLREQNILRACGRGLYCVYMMSG